MLYSTEENNYLCYIGCQENNFCCCTVQQEDNFSWHIRYWENNFFYTTRFVEIAFWHRILLFYCSTDICIRGAFTMPGKLELE